MTRALSIFIALVALSLTASCANPAEDRRLQLEALSHLSTNSALPREQRVAMSLDILDSKTADSARATMRWQAARNLGELRALEAYNTLVKYGLSEFRDGDASVRRECVIALGKLPYSGPLDARRQALIDEAAPNRPHPYTLKKQIMSEERDPLARMAMLDTIITLGMRGGADKQGYRDCAACLEDIARQLDSERQGTRDFRAAEGMIERAFEGLALLTVTSDREAREQRRRFNTVTAYCDWWLDEHIKKMQRMDSLS